MTFFEYTLCEQDVPVNGEIMDAEIIQTATNVGGGGYDADDKPPKGADICRNKKFVVFALK